MRGRELVNKRESSAGAAAASYCQAEEGIQETHAAQWGLTSCLFQEHLLQPEPHGGCLYLMHLHMEAAGAACAPGFIL